MNTPWAEGAVGRAEPPFIRPPSYELDSHGCGTVCRDTFGNMASLYRQHCGVTQTGLYLQTSIRQRSDSPYGLIIGSGSASSYDPSQGRAP